MITEEKTQNKTVADLYSEAAKLMKEEMAKLKKKPLSEKEAQMMEVLAKGISNSVLKEMKLI